VRFHGSRSRNPDDQDHCCINISRAAAIDNREPRGLRCRISHDPGGTLAGSRSNRYTERRAELPEPMRPMRARGVAADSATETRCQACRKRSNLGASRSTWAIPTPPSRAGSARTRSSSSSGLLAGGRPEGPALSPRLLGPPGIGKTTLAMAAAGVAGSPLYINSARPDTRPEDLLITPVARENGHRSPYHGSPLVSAMLTGGVCVLDEGTG